MTCPPIKLWVSELSLSPQNLHTLCQCMLMTREVQSAWALVFGFWDGGERLCFYYVYFFRDAGSTPFSGNQKFRSSKHHNQAACSLSSWWVNTWNRREERRDLFKKNSPKTRKVRRLYYTGRRARSLPIPWREARAHNIQVTFVVFS